MTCLVGFDSITHPTRVGHRAGAGQTEVLHAPGAALPEKKPKGGSRALRGRSGAYGVMAGKKCAAPSGDGRRCGISFDGPFRAFLATRMSALDHLGRDKISQTLFVSCVLVLHLVLLGRGVQCNCERVTVRNVKQIKRNITEPNCCGGSSTSSVANPHGIK